MKNFFTRKKIHFLFTCLLVLGFFIRGLVAVLFQTRAWIDEVWVVLNPAYQFLTGVGELKGDWVYGIRSWVSPTLLGLYLKVLKIFGIEQGTLVLPLVRFSIATLGSYSFYVFSKFLAEKIKLKEAPIIPLLILFFIPEFIHYSGMADLSVLAMPFLLLGLVLCLEGEKVHHRRTRVRAAAGAFLLTFSALIRFQYGVFAAAVFFLYLLRRNVRNWSKLTWLISISSFLVFADIAYNSYMQQRFLFPLLNYFQANALQGMAAGYGITPFYFAFEILWRFVSEPVFALIILMAPFALIRLPFLAGISFLFFAIHAFIGHKEYRFFYGPGILLAAVAGAAFQKWLEESFASRKPALILFLTFFVAFGVLRAKKINWRDYEIPSKLETLAGTQSDVRGVIMYGWGGIYAGGNYTLYRPIPYVSAQSRQELLSQGIDPEKFNYLIVPESENVPCTNKITQIQGGALYRCSTSELKALLERP